MKKFPQRIGNLLYGPKKDIYIENKGLGRAVFDKMQEFSHRIMQTNSITGEQQTYADVQKKLIRIALKMRQRGIKANDVVLSCSYISMDALLPIYSTLYLNAVTVTLDPSISLKDSAHLVRTVSPKLVFVIPEAVDLIENVIRNLDDKPEIVVMGLSGKYATLSEFLEPQPNANTFVPEDVKDIQDVSNIFFSSGTTGLPKAVMHTNFSMLTACELVRKCDFDWGTFLFYTSFYWISAFLFTTTGILAGTNKIYAGKFSPETFMNAIEKYKVTIAFLSSTLAMQFTEENTKNYNKRSFKDFLMGGSPLNESHINNLLKYFPTTGLRNGYAQTESGTPVLIFTESSDSLQRKHPGSCGVPQVNTIIKIVDLDSRRALGPMEKGEICIKSDATFREYIDINNTKEDPYDKDGFLKSGDIGYYNEDGCVYFCDRIKEMFKYKSWHVVPASIEAVIYEHPAVLETVVIGVPHEIDENHPLALVIIREGYNVTEEELLSFVNERVDEREKLRAGLKIVKKFPKTPTGKIARPKIRQLVYNGNLQQLI